MDMSQFRILDDVEFMGKQYLIKMFLWISNIN